MSEYVTPNIPRKDNFPNVDESALAKPVENPHDQRFKIIGTCEHCRFWAGPDESNPVIGICMKSVEIEYYNYTADKIKACSDSIHGDNVWSGKDFGCIQWEGKE